MEKSAVKQQKRAIRHTRIRARVSGTAARPRLAVFRSNRYVYAQLIDDDAQKTIIGADSRNKSGKNQQERAAEVGKAIAALAKEKGIESVVFDRGGFRYQGVVATLAESAREAGLKF